MTEAEARCAVSGKPFANPHRLRAKYVLVQEYGTDQIDELTHELLDSVVPACCDEGCQVEPDGSCEHGCPSVMLALGLI